MEATEVLCPRADLDSDLESLARASLWEGAGSMVQCRRHDIKMKSGDVLTKVSIS